MYVDRACMRLDFVNVSSANHRQDRDISRVLVLLWFQKITLKHSVSSRNLKGQWDPKAASKKIQRPAALFLLSFTQGLQKQCILPSGFGVLFFFFLPRGYFVFGWPIYLFFPSVNNRIMLCSHCGHRSAQPLSPIFRRGYRIDPFVSLYNILILDNCTVLPFILLIQIKSGLTFRTILTRSSPAN
jgi:hypothetical protein